MFFTLAEIHTLIRCSRHGFLCWKTNDPKGKTMTEKETRSDQIELKLYQKQEELTTARARYFGLYDLAQVGYCIISEEGLILETNLTAASLLGVARGALVKQLISSFILKKNQNIYYLCLKQLLKPGTPQTCEMRMVKNKGTAFLVRDVEEAVVLSLRNEVLLWTRNDGIYRQKIALKRRQARNLRVVTKQERRNCWGRTGA
jgi:PAS domain S-box-containing protein